MMPLRKFTIHQPKTIAEAAQMLAEFGDKGRLYAGGTATHRAIERSPVVKQHLPVLAEMETQVANLRVRASGTLGGNLCFAEPHSDPATLLVALGARALVQGNSGSKTVSIDKLMTGAY